MKNPAEEMAIAWLQECKGMFTMNNVRVSGSRAEIDILATGKGQNIWVEVSVSTNPISVFRKEVRFESTVNEHLRDFTRPDKIERVREYFGDNYEKWFIYGKLPLPQEEKDMFEVAMQSKGVHIQPRSATTRVTIS